MPAEWRCLHDNEAAALKVSHEPLRHHAGHQSLGIVDPLPPLIPEGKRQAIGDVYRIGRKKLDEVVGRHARRVSDRWERSENKGAKRCRDVG